MLGIGGYWLRVSKKDHVPLFRYIPKANIEHIINGHYTLSEMRTVVKVVEGFWKADKLWKSGPWSSSEVTILLIGMWEQVDPYLSIEVNNGSKHTIEKSLNVMQSLHGCMVAS